MDGKLYTLVHQFVNEETARDAKISFGTPYLTWADQGHITITPGNVTDFGVVRDHIIQAAEDWNIQSIAFDRKFSPYIVPSSSRRGWSSSPSGRAF